MAVTFFTSTPQKLLKSFNDRISQKEEKGKITTWEKRGNLYTHKAADWHEKAWFKPSTETDRLIFNIIRPDEGSVTVTVFGYYHGHLIETFLNHFDNDFDSASASAKCITGDQCKPKS